MMRTHMQETSLLAYAEIKKETFAPKHKEVIDILRDNPTMDFTNRELLREIRLYDPIREINSVTPRVYELRGKGKNNPYRDHPHIIESQKRPCKVTERMAIAWQLNNK